MAYLRKAKVRTCQAPKAVIASALQTVTTSDARAWFTHCGYALP